MIKDPRQGIRDTIASQCRTKLPRVECEHESIEDWMRRTGLTPEKIPSQAVPRVGYPRPVFSKRRGGGES